MSRQRSASDLRYHFGMAQTRREWLARVPAAMAASGAMGQTPSDAHRPNLVLMISDQFRWDNVGAMGLNPMHLTPNLDAMAAHGVMFRNAFSAQPVCAPARGSIFTGTYPSRHGVWRNGIALREDAVTWAKVMKRAGYSTNYIGKWHLGPHTSREDAGPVALPYRGGFDDLWEGSNELEWTSHAYEGNLYDNDGKPIHFSGRWRADFLTDRGERFLRGAKSPFFLVLSYLETHHQNDSDTYDPPKELKGRYPNPFIPYDLRPFPGSWPSQLSDYYSCVTGVDRQVGRVRRILQETGLADNTILMFISDHACHFKTRNTEYKRSPQEGSIHVPLIVEGPGFNRSLQISELVSQVDYMPSMLHAVGLEAPDSVQGHNFLPLLDGHNEGWRNEVYFEMREFVNGRGLRTPQFSYAAMAPKQPGWRAAESAEKYVEYAMYDLYADPYQLVNLAGRGSYRERGRNMGSKAPVGEEPTPEFGQPYREVAQHLRERLSARIQEASGQQAAIDPCWFPYS